VPNYSYTPYLDLKIISNAFKIISDERICLSNALIEDFYETILLSQEKEVAKKP